MRLNSPSKDKIHRKCVGRWTKWKRGGGGASNDQGSEKSPDTPVHCATLRTGWDDRVLEFYQKADEFF